MGIHRAGSPVDRLHRSYGDATERSGDRESILGICSTDTSTSRTSEPRRLSFTAAR
jgi:hypothetical protein